MSKNQSTAKIHGKSDLPLKAKNRISVRLEPPKVKKVTHFGKYSARSFTPLSRSIACTMLNIENLEIKNLYVTVLFLLSVMRLHHGKSCP